MKIFQWDEIFQAYEYVQAGEQALHLHPLTQGHPLFRRYKEIAHLLDMDAVRLEKTARSFGVRVIKIEHPGTIKQHIDLCGRPLEKARALAEARR